MITVKIGDEERQCPVSADWINQQIKGRKESGGTPCVRVTVRASGVDLPLASVACGGGGGGRRRPTEQEQAIIDLWVKHQLNQPDFSGGQLVAFLRQIGCS